MTDFTFCPQCRTELVVAERGGATRRVCPDAACGFVAWNNPVPIVATIVERDGCVILVRSRGWPDGYFGLVAGFIETGELPADAARREVVEEIGLDIERVDYVGTYPFAERNQLIFVFHGTAPPGDITLCEEELADFRSVPIERLVPWSRGTGPALRDWLASRGFDREPVPFGRHMADD